jgi:hypothetical protein
MEILFLNIQYLEGQTPDVMKMYSHSLYWYVELKTARIMCNTPGDDLSAPD